MTTITRIKGDGSIWQIAYAQRRCEAPLPFRGISAADHVKLALKHANPMLIELRQAEEDSDGDVALTVALQTIRAAVYALEFKWLRKVGETYEVEVDIDGKAKSEAVDSGGETGGSGEQAEASDRVEAGQLSSDGGDDPKRDPLALYAVD